MKEKTIGKNYRVKFSHLKIKNIYDKINPLVKRIEAKKKYQDTRWYKKYSNRVYDKIRNYVKDLHYKTALNLVKKFDIIALGNMSTKSVCSKSSNLYKKIKSTAYMISHYKFRQILEYKSKQYGSRLVIVDESYTSKTCGRCRTRNNVGSSKTFKCSNCNLVCDRDVNGARNILLKHLGMF